MSTKILIVYHAGAMLNARRIYQALAKAGDFALTVIVPQRLQVDPIYDPRGWLEVEGEEVHDGYRLIPVPLRMPFDYSQGFEPVPLQRAIAEARPDLIHVLDEPTSGYLFQVVWQEFRLRLRRRAKVIFYGFDNLPIRLSRQARLKWKLTWARMAGGVAANSEALDNVRRAGFPADRPLERIFWGIPTDHFAGADGKPARRALGLERSRVVGFAGRFVHEKGLTVLLAAIRRLPPDVHGLLIGNGPMRSELELWSSLPGLEGRIHIREVVDARQIPAHLAAMDALAIPSLTTPQWKEQYGRVIGEAMACGVPVVGSDSGAIPEVIGDAGLIVREGNPAVLAEALRSALFDPEVRARLVRQGMQRAQRALSAEAMADALAAFYSRLMRC